MKEKKAKKTKRKRKSGNQVREKSGEKKNEGKEKPIVTNHFHV